MLISRATAPEQPVEWTDSCKMAKRIFTNFNFFLYIKFAQILTNFKIESHEFSNYAWNILFTKVAYDTGG